jgi:hypothetical protein
MKCIVVFGLVVVLAFLPACSHIDRPAETQCRPNVWIGITPQAAKCLGEALNSGSMDVPSRDCK